LSGEAHCRADIGLPGAQTALIEALATTGKPLVLVLMTGRPLALERVLPHLSAVLCAWHPGCMGGRALADLLLGVHAPSGKLPVTFPRVSGQVPMYYAHKHTGKPPTPETFLHIDHIPVRAPQLSVGNTSFHLDAHYTPLWPFGFGLSYVHFAYENLISSPHALPADGALRVHVDVTNTGDRRAAEVVQLYVRDLVGNVTRPVRELKAFRKVWLDAGERRTVSFVLTPDDLAFYGRNNQRLIEPGRFHLWVGGSSTASLHAEFVLNAPPLA
jgi:beta-glucosidase